LYCAISNNNATIKTLRKNYSKTSYVNWLIL
jgi:hypothetical protein